MFILYYIGVSIIFKCMLANDLDYIDDDTEINELDGDEVDSKHKPIKMGFDSLNSIETDEVLPERLDRIWQSKKQCSANKLNDTSTVASIVDTPRAEDTIAGYPYAASVLRMGSHYASGALVDKRWVLTAAGVFYNVRETIRLFRVRLGSVDCKSGGKLLPIQRIVIHPVFTPGKPGRDLAMLRLAEPVELAVNIQPISFMETNTKADVEKFQMIYWPRIIVNGKPLPAAAKDRRYHNILRVSTQRLMPFKKCALALDDRREELSEDQFCLQPYRQDHTSCLADAGAPVVVDGGLWGITSAWVGDPCTTSDPSPVVVARVSPPAVIFWIEAQLSQEIEDKSR